VTKAIRESVTDLFERITRTDDAFCPPSTASIRVWHSRISPQRKLQINDKQPSRNSFPSTTGQCRPECIRWRPIHHERHQNWETAGRIHEPIGNEQRSSNGWHELSLTSEGDRIMSCLGISRERRLLRIRTSLVCSHETYYCLLSCPKLPF
jgi:hypothetical protein